VGKGNKLKMNCLPYDMMFLGSCFDKTHSLALLHALDAENCIQEEAAAQASCSWILGSQAC